VFDNVFYDVFTGSRGRFYVLLDYIGIDLTSDARGTYFQK